MGYQLDKLYFSSSHMCVTLISNYIAYHVDEEKRLLTYLLPLLLETIYNVTNFRMFILHHYLRAILGLLHDPGVLQNQKPEDCEEIRLRFLKYWMGMKILTEILFFTAKEERRTRGHGVTLATKQCRLDIRKCSFSQRIVNEWNRLSADCVGASSVNIFKNKINTYLRRAGYT